MRGLHVRQSDILIAKSLGFSSSEWVSVTCNRKKLLRQSRAALGRCFALNQQSHVCGRGARKATRDRQIQVQGSRPPPDDSTASCVPGTPGSSPSSSRNPHYDLTHHFIFWSGFLTHLRSRFPTRLRECQAQCSQIRHFLKTKLCK